MRRRVGRVIVGLVGIAAVAAACTSSTPTPSSPLTARTTPQPSPSASTAATYADGLPMEIDGEHVYRPVDAEVVSGGAQLLVGGWEVGWIVPACVPQSVSPPPGCPESAQLADVPNGPTVLIVRWPPEAGQVGPGVVLRVAPTDVGCSDGSGSCVAPTVVGSAVVWTGTPVASAAPPSSPTARACVAGDVAIGQVWWSGATATMAGDFTLVDVGSTACRIAGRPTSVSILDPSGKALAIRSSPDDAPSPSEPVVLSPQTAAVPSVAVVNTFWTNWCGPWSRSGTLVVAFATIGRLRAPITGLAAPRCDTPGASSALTFGAVGGPS